MKISDEDYFNQIGNNNTNLTKADQVNRHYPLVHYDTVVSIPTKVQPVEPNADLIVVEELSEAKKGKDSIIVEGSCESPMSLKFDQGNAYSTTKMSQHNVPAPLVPTSSFLINKVD